MADQIEFRPMRRSKQQVSESECRKILTEEKRGTLSVIGDFGYPYTVPINFYYDEVQNCIYFHGARSGHKLEAIQACDKVCFTTWNSGFQTEGHWEWNVTSVIAFGRAKLVSDGAEEQVRKLALKYYPTKEEVETELAASMSHVQLFVIEIEHMTGKLVNER